jgi:hypothetical protein
MSSIPIVDTFSTTFSYRYNGETVNGNDTISTVATIDNAAYTSTTISSNSPLSDNTPNIDKDNLRIPNNETTTNDERDDETIFNLVAYRAMECLYQSDIRRDAIGKGTNKQASSATNWIDDASARTLQQTMDQLCFYQPQLLQQQQQQVDKTRSSFTDFDHSIRDLATNYIRWLKSIPCPAIIDISRDIQQIINSTLTDKSLEQIDQTRNKFLSRIHCRIVVLPSGTTLPDPLIEPPATIVYGKLLYGGVTRYRLIGNSRTMTSTLPQQRSVQRLAGVRTEVKPTIQDIVPTWIMYGGPDRMYESVDMGSAAVLELILYPRGQGMTNVPPTTTTTTSSSNIMQISGLTWKPQFMFIYQPKTQVDDSMKSEPSPLMLSSGNDRNNAFRNDFKSTIGGLQPQIDAIVRRVLDGRVIRPVDLESMTTIDTQSGQPVAQQTPTASMEAEELQLLGLTPVRGLLLYGPPGCGKWI